VKLAAFCPSELSTDGNWREGAPLWKIVPKHDATGKPLVDFMMFAPAMKAMPKEAVQAQLVLIKSVLDRFADVVVFADFNVSLNLLWVSHQSYPGVMSVMVAALRARVPCLKLVAHNPVCRET
jgi:hypothetical protein